MRRPSPRRAPTDSASTAPSAGASSDEVLDEIVFDTIDGVALDGHVRDQRSGRNGVLDEADSAPFVDGVWADMAVPREPIPYSRGRLISTIAVLCSVALVAVAVAIGVTATGGGGSIAAVASEEYTLQTSNVQRLLPERPVQRWQAEFDGVLAGDFAVGEQVAVAAVRNDADASGADVVALDLETGDERWRREFGLSTDLADVIRTDFGIVLITLATESGGTVFAIEETTGEQRWSFSIRSFEGVVVVPGIDAVLHVAADIRYMSPETGEQVGSHSRNVVGVDDERIFFVDDGLVHAASIVGGAFVTEPFAQVGEQQLLPSGVVGDSVIGFDDENRAWALAPIGAETNAEIRVPIVGLDEPDEFDVDRMSAIPGGSAYIVGSDQVFGMELVDGELRVEWSAEVLAFEIRQTRGERIARVGSNADRGSADSPTVFIDARTGRRLAGSAEISIVDEVTLVDDGLVVDIRSPRVPNGIVAFDYYGVEQWRIDRAEGAVRVADGVVVVAGRASSSSGVVITAYGDI